MRFQSLEEAQAQTTSEGAKWRLEKEHLAREYCIAVEEVKIMQEKLRECYWKEGVNYKENCQDLAKAVWKKIHTPNYGAPGPPMGVRRALPQSLFSPALAHIHRKKRAHRDLCYSTATFATVSMHDCSYCDPLAQRVGHPSPARASYSPAHPRPRPTQSSRFM